MARRFFKSQIATQRLSNNREAEFLSTWRRAANPSAGSGTGDMLKATYDADSDGFVEAVKVPPAALPAAGATYAGRFWHVAGAVGTSGTLYFCCINSSGSYEWVQVSQSS